MLFSSESNNNINLEQLTNYCRISSLTGIFDINEIMYTFFILPVVSPLTPIVLFSRLSNGSPINKVGGADVMT